MGGLVAGAATAALVVGAVPAPVDAPDAAAAEALNAAAEAAISVDVLEPARGRSSG
ncbi:hypothetical protein [Microbacterium sp. JB110]|uniref:hypothetical protein n=1 Tax=unclassified Microbacterium TaxID=2609290 RepID=UPI00097F2D61|nr:hypothetical protein [Microbacterium sp. JB110]SJM63005.1 hypothetical protein CZ774_11720 [Frigoribacterium sp. JB110]